MFVCRWRLGISRIAKPQAAIRSDNTSDIGCDSTRVSYNRAAMSAELRRKEDKMSLARSRKIQAKAGKMQAKAGRLWVIWVILLLAWTFALVTPYPVQAGQKMLPPEATFPISKLLHAGMYAFLTAFGAFLPLHGWRRWLPLVVMSLHGFAGQVSANLCAAALRLPVRRWHRPSRHPGWLSPDGETLVRPLMTAFTSRFRGKRGNESVRSKGATQT